MPLALAMMRRQSCSWVRPVLFFLLRLKVFFTLLSFTSLVTKLLGPPLPPTFPTRFADNIFTLDVMEEPVIATDGFTYEKRLACFINAAMPIHFARL